MSGIVHLSTGEDPLLLSSRQLVQPKKTLLLNKGSKLNFQKQYPLIITNVGVWKLLRLE